MDTPERASQRSFGKRARFYAESCMHANPRLLAAMVALAAPQPSWRALDIATGTGHAALAMAPHVRRVFGLDLTKEMLREGVRLGVEHGVSNVDFVRGTALKLPFKDGAFDLVLCRRAAHHFSRVGTAIDEIRRVLVPAGRLVIDDRAVPEDDFVDTFMNTLDRYHDPSHVRSYRPHEWQEMLRAASFRIDAIAPYAIHRPLTSLTDGASPSNARRIHSLLQGLDATERKALHLSEVDGEPYINHWFLSVAATLSH